MIAVARNEYPINASLKSKMRNKLSHSLRGRLALAAAALLLIIYASLIEPNWLEVAIHTQSAKDSGERIRIVQLSDLHLRQLGRREAAIAQELQQLRPDILILSGDVLDRADALPLLDVFLKTLGNQPQRVAVLGNWEHWASVDLGELRSLYQQRHHFSLLVNQGQSYRIGSRSVYIAGMDDFLAGHADIRFATPPQGTDITILIQHSPAWFAHASAANSGARFDLCLAGHTHGGQLTLFGLPLWVPEGSEPFVAGFYDTPNCKLYVSRGIGTSIFPARLGARPEIAVFEL